jgi:hypothetical protein
MRVPWTKLAATLVVLLILLGSPISTTGNDGAAVAAPAGDNCTWGTGGVTPATFEPPAIVGPEVALC